MKQHKYPPVLRHRGWALAVSGALALTLALPGATLAKTNDQVDKYSMLPLSVTTGGSGVTPLVMLNASNDHQLFFKAYSDYSDVDGDGAPDTTYRHTFDYYGYFDSYKCYAYNPTWVGPAQTTKGNKTRKFAGRFVPVGYSASKYCNLKTEITAETVNKCRKELTVDPVKSKSADEREEHYKKCLLDDDGTAYGNWGNSASELTKHDYIFDADLYKGEGWKKLQFSGNFLNWVTMSRIDAVRKILFGGHRRVDTKEDTVLERAFLPPDAHSWAKHYAGPDLRNLSPFVRAEKTEQVSGPVGTVNTDGGGLGYQCDEGGTSLCTDQNQWGVTFGNTTSVFRHYYSVSGDNNAYKFSQFAVEPPIMKTAMGNYSLWAASEGFQLAWKGTGNNQQDNNDGTKSHDNWWLGNVPGGIFTPLMKDSRGSGNDSTKSGIHAKNTNPDWEEHLGWGQYIVRVQACVEAFQDETKMSETVKAQWDQVRLLDSYTSENCKKYPEGNWKPIGLLQEFGDKDQLHFGMVAGTYHNHTKGGALVRNIGSLRGTETVNQQSGATTYEGGEVNPDDGTFPLVAQFAGGPAANDESKGIINAWSLYRIVGWNYAGLGYYNSGDKTDGTYVNDNSDHCLYLIPESSISADGRCKNWGNPFTEIYAQSLNYLAGKGIIGAYVSDGDDQIIEGLPKGEAAVDPLAGQKYECVPLTIININSSVLSYDADNLDKLSLSAIWGSAVSGKSIVDLTREAGDKLGVNGKTFFFGETLNADGSFKDGNQLCTAKTMASLGDAGGICPEAPRLHGSYRLAGLAHYAHEHDIRQDIKGKQTVSNYGVALAAGTPVIEVPDPEGGKSPVTIMPACSMYSGPNVYGRCAIVDFQIVSQEIDKAAGTVKSSLYVNWEDMEAGGDYDQDMWGMLKYEYNKKAKTFRVETKVFAQSASPPMAFGYVLNGTTDDGFHAHSGINGYPYKNGALVASLLYDATAEGDHCGKSYTDPQWQDNVDVWHTETGTFSGCWPHYGVATATGDLPNRTHGRNNTTIGGASWKTYTVGASSAQSLKDPLEYASFGGAFYYAHDPSQLEKSLRSVFAGILETSASGTAAAASPSNTRGEGAIYQAGYTPATAGIGENKVRWTGKLQALWIDNAGYTREDCSPSDFANGGDVGGICVDLPAGYTCTPNGILDSYCVDRVTETKYDPASKSVKSYVKSSERAHAFRTASLEGVVLGTPTVASNGALNVTMVPYSMEGHVVKDSLQSNGTATTLTLEPYSLTGTVTAWSEDGDTGRGTVTMNVTEVKGPPGESAGDWDVTTEGGAGSGTSGTSLAFTTGSATFEVSAGGALLDDLRSAAGGAGVQIMLSAGKLVGDAGLSFDTWHVQCLPGGSGESTDTMTLTWSPNMTLTVNSDLGSSCANVRLSTYDMTATGNRKPTEWQVQNLSKSGLGGTSSSTLLLSNEGNRTFTAMTDSADDEARATWIKAGDRVLLSNTPIEARELTPIWSAQSRLTELDETTLSANRTYAASAATGRYIMTWVDKNLDGIIQDDEYLPFEADAVAKSGETLYRFFDVGASEAGREKAKNIVNWIRGVENANLRSRTVAASGGTAANLVQRLGDIIDSNPTVVSTPMENYDILYGHLHDGLYESYRDFRSTYQDRRIVVYSGANDGLLHAFNGGFYKCLDSNRQKCEAGSEPKYTSYETMPPDGAKLPVKPTARHPLGAELWSYAPGAALPHLRWLTEREYGDSTHMYYVNGVPRVFDANIFNKDESHKDCTASGACWGTILVVGMEKGGSPITVEGVGPNGEEHVFHSSYLVFDVTNPEVEPKMLGEIPVPDKSFATVYPAAVSFDSNGKGALSWYLVFGNGPKTIGSNLDAVTTDENATVYLFNLRQLVDKKRSETPKPKDCELANLIENRADSYQILTCKSDFENSFTGPPSVVDWDLNFVSNSAYIGVIGGQEIELGSDGKVTDASARPAGGVLKLNFFDTYETGKWTLDTFYKTDRPVTAQPMVGIDNRNYRWVYFGTGRLMSTGDRSVYYDNYLYGIKDGKVGLDEEDEGKLADGYTEQELADVSYADVFTDGSMLISPDAPAPWKSGGGSSGIMRVDDDGDLKADGELGGYTQFDQLMSAVDANLVDGWRRYLPYIVNACPNTDDEREDCYNPSTRNLTRSILAGGVLFATAYEPSENPCEGLGKSRLYAVNYKTGTANPAPILGVRMVSGERYKDEEHREGTRLLSMVYQNFVGQGLATEPAVKVNNDGTATVFTQFTDYTLEATEANLVEDVKPGRISWERRSEDDVEVQTGSGGYDEGDDLNIPKP